MTKSLFNKTLAIVAGIALMGAVSVQADAVLVDDTFGDGAIGTNPGIGTGFASGAQSGGSVTETNGFAVLDSPLNGGRRARMASNESADTTTPDGARFLFEDVNFSVSDDDSGDGGTHRTYIGIRDYAGAGDEGDNPEEGFYLEFGFGSMSGNPAGTSTFLYNSASNVKTTLASWPFDTLSLLDSGVTNAELDIEIVVSGTEWSIDITGDTAYSGPIYFEGTHAGSLITNTVTTGHAFAHNQSESPNLELSIGRIEITEISDVEVTPPQLIGHWKFEATSGTVATNSAATGSVYDGTIVGSPVVVDGFKDGTSAREFGDGITGHVDIPIGAFSTISNEITVAMWTYGDDSLGDTVESSAFGSNIRNMLHSHLPWSDGQVYWDVGDDRNKGFYPPASDYKGKWNHWIFTKNATNGVAKVYINGEEAKSWSTGTTPISGLTHFYIGRAGHDSRKYYGKLDEFRLYNYEISADEIFSISRPSWHVEAEGYTSHSGTQTANVEDLGGGEYIGWIDNGDWAEYTINVETAGLHSIDFRVAANGGDGSIDIVSGGSTNGSVIVGDTGGWQSWVTKTVYVNFTTAGTQTLRLNFVVPTGGFNVNWFSYKPTGDPVALDVGGSRKQMMRYGLDYERLWYWYGSQVEPVAEWSVNDCNIDYIRTAVVGGYELDEAIGSGGETNYNLSAYSSKVIPMMTAMQQANPNIKWFASPRPLNESYPSKKWNGSNVTWQPYPIWVTGATTPISGDYNFDYEKCAEYLIRYLRLMKHYGFKITYLDLTNEWQSNDGSGGRINQAKARDLVEYMKAYIANPPAPASDPTDPTGYYAANYPALEPGDMPLTIAASSWNYSQGASWINNLDTARRRDAIDIASSHNTDKTGTAADFYHAATNTLGADVEVWETEQHGWKSTSSANEVTSFSYYMETIRAGFTGISGWLAIGTTSQGHAYLLNSGGTVTRNVKYYIFKKLSNTSNYGYALDADELSTDSTMAFVRDNLLTVWVNNPSASSELVEIDITGHVRDGSPITYTHWNETFAVEGVEGTPTSADTTSFIATIEGESLYCFEIPLIDNEDNFPLVQAEEYDSISGVTDQGSYVTFNGGGSETAYDLDIVKTYPHDVAFRVSSASANIAFDIYDGTNLLASVDRVATGGAQSWTTVYKTLMLDGGPMELRIVAAGGGWNLDWIQFDQQFYSITGSSLENLAIGLSTNAYSASIVHSAGYEADKAFDGDTGTRWASSGTTPWLEVDFGTPTSVNGSMILDYGDRTKGYEIQYYDGTWKTAFVGGDPDDAGQVDSFPTVTGTKFRLQITSGGNASIWEFELYYTPTPDVSSMTIDGSSLSLEWSGVEGSTYALQCTTNLMTTPFVTIESGIPVHEATNSNVLAIPNDAAFYRIILED